MTEWREEGDGLPAVRVHHHVVLSCGLSRDELEGLWYRGASAGPRQAKPDGVASALVRGGEAMTAKRATAQGGFAQRNATEREQVPEGCHEWEAGKH